VVCPTGCCPNPGWVCCPDGIYCTPTIDLCPGGRMLNKLINLAAKTVDPKCDGPVCAGGCCPHSGYVCCPDGLYCASTLEKCPGRKVSTWD
jgi:hypothetical protein